MSIAHEYRNISICILHINKYVRLYPDQLGQVPACYMHSFKNRTGPSVEPECYSLHVLMGIFSIRRASPSAHPLFYPGIPKSCTFGDVWTPCLDRWGWYIQGNPNRPALLHFGYFHLFFHIFILDNF
jgi:hypothetical protein